MAAREGGLENQLQYDRHFYIGMDMAQAFNRQMVRSAAVVDTGCTMAPVGSTSQSGPASSATQPEGTVDQLMQRLLSTQQPSEHGGGIDRKAPEYQRMKNEFKSFTIEIGRQNIIDDMRLVQFVISILKRGSAALASRKHAECNELVKVAICGLMQKLYPEFATEQGVGIKDEQIISAIENFPEFNQGMCDRYMEESRKKEDFIGDKKAARDKVSASSASTPGDNTDFLPHDYYEKMSELQIGTSTFNQIGRDILTATKEIKEDAKKNTKMLSRTLISMQAYLESRLDPQEPDCESADDSSNVNVAGSK